LSSIHVKKNDIILSVTRRRACRVRRRAVRPISARGIAWQRFPDFTRPPVAAALRGSWAFPPAVASPDMGGGAVAPEGERGAMLARCALGHRRRDCSGLKLVEIEEPAIP